MYYTYLPVQFTILDEDQNPAGSGTFNPDRLIWSVECSGQRTTLDDPSFPDAYNWVMGRVHDPIACSVSITAGVSPGIPPDAKPPLPDRAN
jgi:hypothetical protein